MKHIGVVAGSFDPITRGHMAMLDQASSLVDKLYIVVGQNPTKKGMFTEAERIEMIKDCKYRATVITLGDELLADFAASVGATHLIRGIRNAQDLQYEHDIMLINKKIQPSIETVFVLSPRELTEISSSVVKGFMKFKGWERIVKDYVAPHVLDRLKEKANAS